MPVVRHAVTSDIIVNTNDLRGVDLSEASRYTNYAGALRNEDDPPVRGWVVENGAMVLACGDCRERPALDCGECGDCCSHDTCDDCGLHMDRGCTECGDCNDCCSCRFCDACSRLADCEYDCGYCVDHCECEGHTCNPGAPWHAPKKSKFPSKRLAGVEWEYNDRVNLRAWAEKWRGGIHTDGSCGWEAVTPPVAGDYIAQCLRELGRELNAHTSANEDCGLHVHVDARDIRWSDMYRMLKLYSKLEPVLFILAGQERLKNTYCAPCGDKYARAITTTDPKGSILGTTFGNTAKLAREYVRGGPCKKDGGRYKALNLVPWIVGRKKNAPDTTIEFRLGGNTLDAERVISWTHICVSIVDWVATHSDAELDKLPKSALRTLCQIAPTEAAWIMAEVREWRRNTAVIKSRPLPRSRPEVRRVTLTNQGYQVADAA